jgi:hypothetical protein
MRFLLDEMFPPKSRLPQRGMAEHLAQLLDAWATANPDPYLGLHWPGKDR